MVCFISTSLRLPSIVNSSHIELLLNYELRLLLNSESESESEPEPEPEPEPESESYVTTDGSVGQSVLE
jgi:hypothetical protein